jgi:outer membrane protein OmpA-like peptidoglycan-associated protein
MLPVSAQLLRSVRDGSRRPCDRDGPDRALPSGMENHRFQVVSPIQFSIGRWAIMLGVGLGLLLSTSVARADEEKDVEGAKDHPLVSRMPGYYVSQYEAKDFDTVESAYVTGPDNKWEGRTTRISYTRKATTKAVSMAQLARNHENAFKKAGATILASDIRVVVARFDKGGARTWVEASAFNDGRDYSLLIVESKPMEQEVTVDAASLQRALNTTGKVAVYGIFFDTNKSVIKPASNPTLDEIAKLLRQSPTLALYVVGHTDGTGVLEANLKLSSERAASVAQALVSRGIAAGRLKTAGVGPYCPEAPNQTEDGRAKNRRVELVQR